MEFEVGKIVKGKVVGIANFGAFVEVEGDNDTTQSGRKRNCLVHISEISDGFVKSVEDYLKIGDSVEAKVISVDGNGKVSLSIKQAKSETKTSNSAFSNPPPEYFSGKREKGDFEEMMHSFKQASDEKMSVLKRAGDPKRNSKRRK